ncbi:MAG: fused MFS/spermidine synthase [Acidimicrobiia bacterium]|nr:fused MFS/spermidine synthase [Acidimicrobiia bacterium]
MATALISETRTDSSVFPSPDAVAHSPRMLLGLFTVSSFLGAGLLFAVQPMVAKMLLPLLGGSAAVWNTAMVFFQLTLLAGYAYAHFAVTRLGPRLHRWVQVALIGLPLVLLPIAVPSGWLAPTSSTPIGWVLLVLLIMVGAPFFALSTLSPTLQRWLADTDHPAAANPYFLYAAGNAGSLLALLAYPLILEPTLGVETQTGMWMAGYGLLALLVAGTAFIARPAAGDSTAQPTTRAPWNTRLFWGYAAFVPSALMLGVTRHLATDVASFPLLWVVPLAIYLLTFIIAFRHEPTREVRVASMIVRVSVIPVVLTFGQAQATWLLLALPLTLFAAAGVVAHGRLMLTRPEPSGLTEFYLWISIGGAAGGVFAALLAPVLFDRILEYPIAIALALTLIPATTTLARNARLASIAAVGLAVVAGVARAADAGDLSLIAMAVASVIAYALFRKSSAFTVVLVVLIAGLLVGQQATLATNRTFFGVYRVGDNGDNIHVMASGTTVHGIQQLDARPPVAAGYYHSSGPIGDVMADLRSRPDLDVAIIGLGAGSLAAYARPSDTFRFFEIDPVVVDLASDPTLFTYVSEARGVIEFVIGDGRIMLDRSPDSYDAIVMDAFSSDAIPTHLITREALDVYLKHLRPDGVLAVHISNRHLDLEPVLGRLAAEAGLVAETRDHTPSEAAEAEGATSSSWVVMARAAEQLAGISATPGWEPPPVDGPLWTDSYTSLLSVFRWG